MVGLTKNQWLEFSLSELFG